MSRRCALEIAIRKVVRRRRTFEPRQTTGDAISQAGIAYEMNPCVRPALGLKRSTDIINQLEATCRCGTGGISMTYLVQFWNYKISSGLTAATGLLLLWQYLGSKGTLRHVSRWAAILLVSLLVVYMNTVSVLNQSPILITNPWHVRFMEFHQNTGLIYFALLAAMPLFGMFSMAAVKYRWARANALRLTHRWAGYATGVFWLISNIASEIGSRIPRT